MQVYLNVDSARIGNTYDPALSLDCVNLTGPASGLEAAPPRHVPGPDMVAIASPSIGSTRTARLVLGAQPSERVHGVCVYRALPCCDASGTEELPYRLGRLFLLAPDLPGPTRPGPFKPPHALLVRPQALRQ